MPRALQLHPRWVIAAALVGWLGLGAAIPACAQAAGAAQPVPASQGEQGPSWQSLSPSQRAALQPLQGEWPRIDAGRKQKWLDVASRLPTMSAAEQKRVQIRMAEWAGMTPAERGRARLQFQETRQLTPTDRKERWQAYQSLPSDQRQALTTNATPTAPKPPSKPSTSGTADAKRNVVTFAPPASPRKTVAPTVVQTKPGATTSLVNKPAQPPAHYQAGLPKIAATKGFVDPDTLLPKRGPQGAAIATAPRPPEKPASARR